MWTLEELTQHIQAERARQALLERRGVPDHVRIGSFTALVMERALWRDTNFFPSNQDWADEAERLFNFADSQGQFPRFLPNLRGRWTQFNSALAELRVAFFLHQNSFRIVEWEPTGAAGCRGEFTIACPSGVRVFTEVKSPGWKGELTPEEFKTGRQHQPKYLYCEARNEGPQERVQFEVHKAYEKFDAQNRNLLILADDLFTSLLRGADIWANYAFHSPRTGGCFVDNRYENLGGVGILQVVANTDPIAYEMKVFINPHALPSVALPADIPSAFPVHAVRHSRLRIRAETP
jgi:hypothetical protein